ncbi:MAG: carboxypeptidase regulatory-like domain-containing protein [Planctomycetaceae bacterium]
MASPRAALCALLLAAACGRDEPAPDGAQRGEVGAEGRGTADADPWIPSRGTATLRGRVRLEGESPPRRNLDLRTEPHCHAMHAEFPDESILVDADGSIRNVFVYVKSGLEAWRFPVPSDPAIIDQIGCIYVPRLLGMQLGQKLVFRNSDPILHNVHGTPRRNREWNFGQARQGMETEVEIRRAEVMIPVQCDVHGWMRSYVAVLRHPFFRVTGAGGTFEMTGLPPGDFTIEAWHEEFGTRTQQVALSGAESKELSFTFSP